MKCIKYTDKVMHMIKDEYSRIFMDLMEHFKNELLNFWNLEFSLKNIIR